MTDNEIILGLKCLADEDEILCKDCAFRDMDRGFACKKNVSKAAIDLINRQKADIEELQGNLKFVRGTVERLLELSDEQKAEIESLNEQERILICQLAEERERAIKEFVERLKSTPYRFRMELTIDFDKPPITKMVLFVDDNDIDNIAKEIKEEQP